MRKSPIAILALSAAVLMGFGSCQTQSNTAGIFRSTDNGQNFEAKTTISESSSLSKVDILSMAVDPNAANHVWLGTQAKGLYETKDNGESWQKIESMGNSSITGIIVNPNRSDNVFITTTTQVYRTLDAGEDWEEVFTSTNTITAIMQDPSQPQTIYVSDIKGSLQKTNDFGDHWQGIRFLEEPIHDMDLNQKNPSEIYISGDSTLLRSSDRGRSWVDITPTKKSFPAVERTINRDMYAVCMDHDGEVLYLSSKYGVTKSENKGVSWQPVRSPLEPFKVDVIDVWCSNQDTSNLYFIAETNFYQSTDKGKSWLVRNIPTENPLSVILETDEAIWIGADGVDN